MKEDKKQDELISKISNVNGLSEVVLVALKVMWIINFYLKTF